jgi:hypothetical protein
VSARQEAVEAMRRSPGSSQLYVDPALRGITLGALLDAIPPELLARLAIESGGLEQVGFCWRSLFEDVDGWIVGEREPKSWLPAFPVPDTEPVFRVAGADS